MFCLTKPVSISKSLLITALLAVGLAGGLWWFLSLAGERGLSAGQLADRIGHQVQARYSFDQIGEALSHALSSLGNLDIMLVCGSFVTVESLLHALSEPGKH